MSATSVRSQDWAQVHREDDAKWARNTGLSATTVHRLWRMASHFADERSDDSRIEQVDVTSLAERNQILLVTSAGAKDCITVTVFAIGAKKNSFRKLWSADQTPDGEGFCATRFGRPDVDVLDGTINVNIPDGKNANAPSETMLSAYQYRWEKGIYRYDGKRRMGRSVSQPGRNRDE